MSAASNGLPPGWIEATLGAVAQPSRPRAAPTEHPKDPFIGMEHVEAHSMKLLGTVPAGSMKSSAVRFEAGDVLYGRLRPYLNKVYRPDFRGLCSAEFIVFPDRPPLDGRFLQYRLNAADFMRFASSLNAGDRPRVDFDQLAPFPFRVPPLPEQRRIVAEIEAQFSRLDAGVAALKRVAANLKRYKAAVLKAACDGSLTADWRAAHPDAEPAGGLLRRILAERRRRWEQAELAKMLARGKPPKDDRWKARYEEPQAPKTADLPPLPKTWTWATLDQLSLIQGGIQKQPSRAPKHNAYPFLRVANVLRGRLDLSEMHRVELLNGELSRLRLEVGDLLIVEGNGSRSEIGRSALWLGEIADCVHQNHIIRARPIMCEPSFIDQFWNSPQGSGRVFALAASTSGLYTLSVSKVASLAVPLPPLAEQTAITAETARALSLLSDTLTAVETQQRRASRLRQAILRDAFAGKLVAQDPADEPASALLERIRAREKPAAPPRLSRPRRQPRARRA